MKTCPGCKLNLKEDRFSRNRSIKDGLAGYCKSCFQSKYGSKAIERADKWQKKNKEKHQGYVLEWQKNNLSKYKKYQSQWRILNREKLNIMEANRRALKRSSGSFTLKEWEDLCKSFDYKCVACNEHKKLTVDHVVPLSLGGSNFITNIQPLCSSCNSKKFNRAVDYRGVLK